MISSVVPVKLPVICLRRESAFVFSPMDGPQGDRAAICCVVGTRWFASVLSGRGSHEDRWIREVHFFSSGRDEPDGRVANRASIFSNGGLTWETIGSFPQEILLIRRSAATVSIIRATRTRATVRKLFSILHL